MGELDRAILIEDSQQQIASIGAFLSIGSHGGMDDEQKAIFMKAQSTLLAIPGHAKYYQDKIETMRAEVLANAKKSDAELNALQGSGHSPADDWSYHSECSQIFSTLELMPSPETVAVLGHYLNDPQGRDGKSLLGSSLGPEGDSQGRPCNAALAAQAIRKLGIDQPPRDVPGVPDAAFIDNWKDWWNEVAAGKRTYRFIGSSTEYGPDGPASPELVEKIQRDRRRDEERATGHRPGQTTGTAEPTDSPPAAITRNPGTLVGVIAAMAAIVASLWYSLRARRRRK